MSLTSPYKKIAEQTGKVVKHGHVILCQRTVPPLTHICLLGYWAFIKTECLTMGLQVIIHYELCIVILLDPPSIISGKHTSIPLSNRNGLLKWTRKN